MKSTQEAYEVIAEALNYLKEHGEKVFESDVSGMTHRIVFDQDAQGWYAQRTAYTPREND